MPPFHRAQHGHAHRIILQDRPRILGEAFPNLGKRPVHPNFRELERVAVHQAHSFARSRSHRPAESHIFD
jgi:hypothetical protein